jgi:hypothetical protein
MNAFQAVRERDKVKALIFFTLTALLATVAGLITHFDALGHAARLPVTDKGVSGIIPLWVMTALRAVAVIGFLLASRLKQVPLRALHESWGQEMQHGEELQKEQAVVQIDYHALAVAVVEAMQQAGTLEHTSVVEESLVFLPSPIEGLSRKEKSVNITANAPTQPSTKHHYRRETSQDESVEAKIARVYETIRAERIAEQNGPSPKGYWWRNPKAPWL